MKSPRFMLGIEIEKGGNEFKNISLVSLAGECQAGENVHQGCERST